MTVVGERLELPAPAADSPEPSREDVDRWHAAYVERLKATYYEHRHHHPAYADKELEIW